MGLDAGLANGVIAFPDGDTLRLGKEAPAFTIRFKTNKALLDTMTGFTLGFGEAYLDGAIDLEGSIDEIAAFGYRLAGSGLRPSLGATLRILLAQALQRHTRRADAEHVAAHYDAGNDFFKLILDQTLTYSCAYYEDPTDTLEQAQAQKYEHICRKLHLKAGERVVDCGCGWGGFAFHAAERHGVEVTGYTVSPAQFEHCVAAARARGLERRVRFRLEDYREIGTIEHYDKFVSVGMVEHVGKANLGTYAEIVRRALRPGGLAVVHGICVAHPAKMDPFARKHIFPGAYIPTLCEVLTPFERAPEPLHVVDVENLRHHYVLTLRAWYQRYQHNRPAIARTYGERFARVYELYLGNGPASFRHKDLDLFQIVLVSGYGEELPLTRRALYAAGQPK